MSEAVHNYKAGKFDTYSGKQVSILQPKYEDIAIEDISMGLANVCRFGGQIGRHYSVAIHSLLVMELAPASLCKPAIIHDASEAYLGDVIKPLKHILGEKYAELETLWMRVICEKYGVDYYALNAIKKYDMQALEMEHRYIRLRERESKEMLFMGSFLERFQGKSVVWTAGIYKEHFKKVIIQPVGGW